MCRPKPNFAFRLWSVGQSDLFCNTFITLTETTNILTATLHCVPKREHKWPHPDEVVWELTGSHGFVWTHSAYEREHEYSCTGRANGDKSDTADEARHPSNGRQNTPMSVGIKFTAKYNKRKDVVLEMKIEQDQIDQMRQEYVDAGIEVPDRAGFVARDPTYYDRPDAGYSYMVDAGMRGFREDWERECKAENANAVFRVTGGYRNPHHNDHVGGVEDSRHMYGKALDAQCDFDGRGGYQRARDGQKMKEAAIRAGAPAKNVIIYNSHVHARFN